jgi:hypothetical protein
MVKCIKKSTVITIKIRREYKYRDMMCEMYIVIVAVGDKKKEGRQGTTVASHRNCIMEPPVER